MMAGVPGSILPIGVPGAANEKGPGVSAGALLVTQPSLTRTAR